MKASQALQIVGSSNRYQIYVMLFMCVFWVDVVYMLLGPSYIYMNPTFKCNNHDKILQEEEACPILSECVLVDDGTITATVGLYCDKQFQRNLIQSSMYIGSISGLIIMNIVSDRWGRRFSFIISLGFAIIGHSFVAVGGFTKLVPLLVIGQIFSGFGAYACLTISYIIISDLMADNIRQKGIIGVNAAWALGQMSFCLLYNYLNKWYIFVIGFVLIPLVIQFFVGFFLLVQSPVYLNEYSRQRCAQALNKIAQWNGRQSVQPQQLQVISKEGQQPVSAFEVFKHWPYLKCIILISIFEVTTNMFYYGTQYSMESIGSNFGVNMLIIGLLEFIAYFSSSFFVDKIKRKKSMMILNAIAGSMCLLFILKAVQDSKTLQIIIVPFSRFLLTYCQGILANFMIESFPDRVKSSGSGTIEALSNVGNLITPFVVSLTTNAGLNPVFVVAVILLLGIATLIPTKETYHHVATEQDMRDEEKDAYKQSLISEQPSDNLNS